MSDERRFNEDIQPELKGETEEFSLPRETDVRETLVENVTRRMSSEYFKERILEYAKNEDFEPKLQRKVEQLKELAFDVDEDACYVLCFEILCNLYGKAQKTLKGEVLNGEISPIKRCKNILTDTLKCIKYINKILHVGNLRQLEERCARILESLNASLQGRPAMIWRKSSETLRETLETWLDECESLIEISPQKETGQRSEFGQTDYWFFENNSLRCSRIVSEWLDRLTCSGAFGAKYAKFDDLERLFENESTAQESARELSKFLENPPNSSFRGRDLPFDRNREWALARLYDSLDRYSVFDKLKKCPEVIALDRRDLRKRRDKHICNALRLVAIELLEEAGRIVKFVDREFRGQKELAEEFMQGFHRGENRRRKWSFFFSGVVEGWPDPSMDRTLDTLRNTALLYCYLALADVDENPLEKITATAGTTCLNPTEFEKSLAGKISFKETLVKAQERGKMLDCARAMAFLASRSHKVRYFVEKLLSETEWEVATEAVKTEFYDCLNKLAGKEGIPHKQSLAAAASRFGALVGDFTEFPEGGTVSEVANKYVDLFEKFALSPWYDGVIISLDELKERLFPLKDYAVIKRFETKSRILEDILEYLCKLLNKFTDPKRGSIISELCYHECIAETAVHLQFSYERLFLTTQPQLILGDAKSVEVRRKNDSELVVGVPVSNVSNEYAQNALDVRLIIEDSTNVDNSEDKEIKDHRPPKFVIVESPRVVEILPSGGRTEMMEFILRLLEPRDVFPVRFQLEYKYRCFALIQMEGPTDTEVVSRKTEWFNYDIVVPGGKAAKKKHELKKDRLNAFGGNGGINFNSPGVKQILDNRNEQVNEAINALTEECETDVGRKTRRFFSRGRLVLIFGQWRVGKTVILDLINEKLRHDFPNAATLYFSFQEVGERDNFESYLTLFILRKIRRLFRNNDRIQKLYQEELDYNYIDLKNGGDVDWFSFTQFLKSFIARLHEEANVIFILLVDEFTGIYPMMLNGSVKADFLTRWAQMITTTNLLCIVAGGEHTWEMFETYDANAGQKVDKNIPVGYLNPSDAEKYVRYVMYEAPGDDVPLEDSYFSRETEKAALDRIFKLTRGNPFLLRHLCEWLIDWLKESEVPFLTKTAVDDAIDFKSINEPKIESLGKQLFYSLYDPFNEKNVDLDGKEGAPNVTRLKYDRVRDANKTILDAIVELADPVSHCCGEVELHKLCRKKGMDVETFKRRLRSLDDRNVVIHRDGVVRIFVDLYYEIQARIERKRKNDLM